MPKPAIVTPSAYESYMCKHGFIKSLVLKSKENGRDIFQSKVVKEPNHATRSSWV